MGHASSQASFPSAASPVGDGPVVADRLRRELRSHQVDKARLMGETAILTAHVHGLGQQVAALKAELARLAPRSPLLAPAGIYEDGRPRDASQAIFEQAFDTIIDHLSLPGEPARYRDRKAVISG